MRGIYRRGDVLIAMGRARTKARQRRIALDYIRASYRMRACAVCGLRGMCEHREMEVEAALLGVPEGVIL